MGKYKLAVFDLDGTLLNTLADLASSVNYALAKSNLPQRTESEVKGFIGNGIARLCELSLPENTDKCVFEAVFADFKAHYAVHSADTTAPYRGVKELLHRLKNEGIKIALLSNKADFAVKSLAETHFDGIFDIAVGETEGTPRKPDPQSLNKLMSDMDCSKNETVYIGDSEVDILTAKNAEVDCISVTWGFKSKAFLQENGAVAFASTAEELYMKIKEGF